MASGTDGFAHLHVASGFSMRYGASMPEDLVERAAHHGQHTLALTDRDGLYGAVRFATAATRSGIAPVLGVDLACADSIPANQTRANPARADPTDTDRTRHPTQTGSPPSGTGPMSRQRTPVRGGSYVDARLPRVTVLGRGVVSGVPHTAGWRAL